MQINTMSQCHNYSVRIQTFVSRGRGNERATSVYFIKKSGKSWASPFLRVSYRCSTCGWLRSILIAMQLNQLCFFLLSTCVSALSVLSIPSVSSPSCALKASLNLLYRGYLPCCTIPFIACLSLVANMIGQSDIECVGCESCL